MTAALAVLAMLSVSCANRNPGNPVRILASQVAGYRAAQTVRFLAYFVIFLPIVGVPALIFLLLRYAWRILMLPLRFFRKHTQGVEPKAG